MQNERWNNMETTIIPYLCVAVTTIAGALVWYVKSTRAREDKAIKRQEDREDEDRAYGRQQGDKKQTEIEFINGAIVRQGESLNIATPVNEVLTNLVKTLEKSYDKRQ